MSPSYSDVIVIALVIASVRRIRRGILAMSAVAMFALSFPPYSLPLWFVSLVPLACLWRSGNAKGRSVSIARLVVEALAVGFALSWFSTRFVSAATPKLGWVVHSIGCIVFSLQIVLIACSLRVSSRCGLFLRGGIPALAGIAGEAMEAYLGVTWSVTNLALSAANTPIAQWASLVTVFGVSGLLYFGNFILTWETRSRSLVSVVSALAFGSAIWLGGDYLASTISLRPCPISALLVQPNLDSATFAKRELVLEEVTELALRDHPDVDLIVWPEGSRETKDRQLEIAKYATNVLFGVINHQVGTEERYGLQVKTARAYNCACLLRVEGSTAWHRKTKLIPLREGIPEWCDNQWFRRVILPKLGVLAPYSSGRDYQPMKIKSLRADTASMAVSICYESMFPWLPQYGGECDLVIHLVDDSSTIEFPGVMARQISACQYRAIETRKWNLVCSIWSGSAVIAPDGVVVERLAAEPGYLFVPSETTDASR